MDTGQLCAVIYFLWKVTLQRLRSHTIPWPSTSSGPLLIASSHSCFYHPLKDTALRSPALLPCSACHSAHRARGCGRAASYSTASFRLLPESVSEPLAILSSCPTPMGSLPLQTPLALSVPSFRVTPWSSQPGSFFRAGLRRCWLDAYHRDKDVCLFFSLL